MCIRDSFYVVGQNTGAPRTLTIIAGCETFTVNQDGTAVSNPVPAITTLLPTGTTAGSGAFTLTVNGTGFINGSVVNFNGSARATTYVSATQLTAAILAADIASAGTVSYTHLDVYKRQISGGASDGINISGTSQIPAGYGLMAGNTIQGNFIGTDYTGKQPIPNQGNGVYLQSGATNNIVGGAEPGAGNLIAYNKENGVLIDPGTVAGEPGTGNQTIANTILSNGGAGVRINSGNQNRISQNSIFGNSALGINLDGAGPNLNTNCAAIGQNRVGDRCV